MQGKDKKKTISYFWIRLIYCAIALFMVDAWLRIMTRWLGYYSIYKLAPSLFTVCWIVIIMFVTCCLFKKAGKILWTIVYFATVIYSVAQYVYYLIFNKFFYVTEIAYADEGASYLDYILSLVDLKILLSVTFFFMIGVIGVKMYPPCNMKDKKTIKSMLFLFAIAVTGLWLIPNLYQLDTSETLFCSSSYEYEQFTNSGFDLELTGVFQYVTRDAYKSIKDKLVDKTELIELIDAFFDEKNDHKENVKTGILSGKNIIIVQMESMDDWLVNEETTPTICKLMDEGINFTNMYTCIYGSGSTFATEFAFNTGLYQSLKGTAAYSFNNNQFTFSIPNLFSELDYSVNSFHMNVGTYYNRELMHQAWGYENYYAGVDYCDTLLEAEDDSTLISNESYWDEMTKQEPFLDFFITYSAHVPYNESDELVQYAFTKHSEYKTYSEDTELNSACAKARLTDDMFSNLLLQLEENELLVNTVIIAYTDHYCYGLSNKELIDELSQENGSSILERTPAFIWYDGCESQTVEKVCQTIDWLPTIANMIGKDITGEVLGNDIFDDEYRGYAIFPNGTWLSNEAYIVNGIVRWNDGLDEETIDGMNSMVAKFYEVNEAILASDYYRSK